jgi:hypothetical protein
MDFKGQRRTPVIALGAISKESSNGYYYLRFLKKRYFSGV